MIEIIRGAKVVVYQGEDRNAGVEVRFDGDTAWLSLGQMSELFQRDKSVISRHLRSLFEEGELERDAVVAECSTTGPDGKTRRVDYFNLDVIVSVGYRIKSQRGVQFRIWATQRLCDSLVKGFVVDGQRLKQVKGATYFEDLLTRIRDIRSSEKLRFRKVLDIYKTSVDYEPGVEASVCFFRTVQNKLHWAAHGHTASGLIVARADAGKPNMGLTSFVGDFPRETDVAVAKNYLVPEELAQLDRIVSALLDFAELAAMNRRPMYMADWSAKLDDFLRLCEREVLSDPGQVTRKNATAKAKLEYARFRAACAALAKPRRAAPSLR